LHLSQDTFREVLSEGARWCVQRGYGWAEDLVRYIKHCNRIQSICCPIVEVGSSQDKPGGRPMIVNHPLVSRIEDAMAAERSAFADGMAALRPDAGAGWLPVAGGRAIFTGAGFFSNRAMEMGLRGLVSREDVERVEIFYTAHGVPAEIEIASMVDRSLIGLLNQHGYWLPRFRNIYAQVLRPHETRRLHSAGVPWQAGLRCRAGP
jgi:hypothetical protein